MAEVLGEHRIFSEGWPPRCIECGILPVDTTANAHQAEALTAAGFGDVKDAEAKIAAVRNELAHAEANGHHLDQSCQGVGFTRPAAARIDYIRAALGDES